MYANLPWCSDAVRRRGGGFEVSSGAGCSSRDGGFTTLFVGRLDEDGGAGNVGGQMENIGDGDM